MCGRYFIDEGTKQDILRFADADRSAVGVFPAGRDICPSDTAPILSESGGKLLVSDMQWGFHGKNGQLLINARRETAAERILYAQPLLHRRCIVPAGCFYEWDRDRNKTEFRYDRTPSVYMAGLWRPEEDGAHFVILTAAANDSMIRIHDRMPLVLEEENVKRWILNSAETASLLVQGPPLLNSRQEYEQLSLF